MQPGVTVALATVWLAGATGVLSATLYPSYPSLDQYSPQLPPNHHEVTHSLQSHAHWNFQDPSADLLTTKIDQTSNVHLPIESSNLKPPLRPSIDSGSPDRSYGIGLGQKDADISFDDRIGVKTQSEDSRKVNERLQNHIFDKKEDALQRDLFIAEQKKTAFERDDSDDYDSFQDQGPGSIEVYRLDLFEEGSLYGPKSLKKNEETTKAKNNIEENTLGENRKDENEKENKKAEKKFKHKKDEAKEEETKFMENGNEKYKSNGKNQESEPEKIIPSFYDLNTKFKTEEEFIRPEPNFSNQLEEDAENKSFGEGGVPELQVGCEGVEESFRDKRDASEDSKDHQDVKMPLHPGNIVDVQLIYESDEDEDPQGVFYEERDELIKLQKLEKELLNPPPPRGDIPIDLHEDYDKKEKLPVRGDLASAFLNSDLSDSKRDTYAYNGRKLLFVSESSPPKRRKRNSGGWDGVVWGFGENEGIMPDDEIQTDEKRREEERRRAEAVRRKEEERRREEERKRSHHHHHYHHHRGSENRSEEDERIRKDHERRLEERRRLEEERRHSHAGRNEHNLEAEKRRHDEKRRMQEEQRRMSDHRRNWPMDDQRLDEYRRAEEERRPEEERRRADEERRRQEYERRRVDEERRRQEHERRRADEDRRRADNRRPEEMRRPEEERSHEEERRRHSERRRHEEERRRHEEQRRREEIERRRIQNENIAPSNLMRSDRRQDRPDRRQEEENEKKLIDYIKRNTAIVVSPSRHSEDSRRREAENRRRNEPENLTRHNLTRSRHPYENSHHGREREPVWLEQKRAMESTRQYDISDLGNPESRRRHGPSPPGDIGRRNGMEDIRRRPDVRRMEEEARRLDRERIEREQEEKRRADRIKMELQGKRLEEEDLRRKSQRYEEERLWHERMRQQAEKMRQEWMHEANRRSQADRKPVWSRYQPTPDLNNKGYQPPPDLNNKGYQPPPDLNNKGYQPPPDLNNKGYQPPPVDLNNKGYQPPPDLNNKGYQPPPDLNNKGYQPPPDLNNKGYQPPPVDLNNKGYQPPRVNPVFERDRQRLEQERRRMEAEKQARNRGTDDRYQEQKRRGESVRSLEEQRRRQEEERLSALPVSATIILRPGGSGTNSSFPLVFSRGGFGSEIDFPGISPNRRGPQAARFPAPATRRPPVKGPEPCVWAVVQCCPASDRVVGCFESMGCPGINWDPNPCSPSLIKAAKNEVLKFYTASDQNSRQ